MKNTKPPHVSTLAISFIIMIIEHTHISVALSHQNTNQPQSRTYFFVVVLEMMKKNQTLLVTSIKIVICSTFHTRKANGCDIPERLLNIFLLYLIG